MGKLRRGVVVQEGWEAVEAPPLREDSVLLRLFGEIGSLSGARGWPRRTPVPFGLGRRKDSGCKGARTKLSKKSRQTIVEGIKKKFNSIRVQ